MFAHLSVPVGQQVQRYLALAQRRAGRCGVADEPEFLGDQRQQCPRRVGHCIELRLNEAFARMNFALVQQFLQPLDALGVAPVEGHVIWERGVRDLVVRVGDDTAVGIHRADIRRERLEALPAVLRQPALRRNASLARVRRIAVRDAAKHDHCNRVLVGQHDILRRGDELGGSPPCSLNALRRHQFNCRRHGCVARGERRPCEADDVALRRNLVQIEMRSGDHRPVVGPAQRQGQGRLVPDAEQHLFLSEFTEAVRRPVLCPVRGIELLDIQVLIIQIGRGQPPGQSLSAPNENRRDAGQGAANHAACLQLQPRQHERTRCRQTQMRIVAKQGLTGRRALGRHRKSIRRAGQPRSTDRHQRADFRRCGPDRRAHGRKQRGIFRKGKKSGSRGIGQDIAGFFGSDGQRHLRAPYLGPQLVAELQAHQFKDRDTVGGLPRRNFLFEQKEFRRAAAQGVRVDCFQPGVDAVRIGLQGILRGRRLIVDGRERQIVNIHSANEIIDLYRFISKQLGQAALRRAPRHHHLPQPVLRMGEAKTEVHVAVALAKNMRDVVDIAHDLHRPRQGRETIGCGIIGY